MSTRLTNDEEVDLISLVKKRAFLFSLQHKDYKDLTKKRNAWNFIGSTRNTTGCVVAMTGITDYVSDGIRTVCIQNGHHYLQQITGSGCLVTAAIGCFAGIKSDHFTAALAGILAVNVASERAGRRKDVLGPGSFRTALLDELANLHRSSLKDEFRVEELNSY